MTLGEDVRVKLKDAALDRFKAFLTDIMFHFTGIGGSRFGIHPKADQPAAEQGIIV